MAKKKKTVEQASAEIPKYDPPRQIGRVEESVWESLKEAARLEGKSFTKWAIGVLVKEAKKVFEKQSSKR